MKQIAKTESQISKQDAKSYLPVLLNLSELQISGRKITAYTSQEDCIREDKSQLSSLIKTKKETIKEEIEYTVGRFKKKATLEKLVVTEIDNSEILAIIELEVIEIFEWFGKDIKHSLSKSTAEMIYNNYYWLKLSELKLFTEKMKNGNWEQKHNLSPAVLMERLKDFANDSMNIREQMSDMAVEKNKDVFIPLSDDQKKLFTEFANKLANNNSGQKSETEKLHRNSAQTIQYFKENNFCYEWLEKQNIPKEEKHKWYQLFLIRKQK